MLQCRATILIIVTVCATAPSGLMQHVAFLPRLAAGDIRTARKVRVPCIPIRHTPSAFTPDDDEAFETSISRSHICAEIALPVAFCIFAVMR